MEEYQEENAKARAFKGKIMTIDKYKGEKPGKLNFKVTYNRGTLTVSLGQAWLAGKRSQDPYALVYLLSPSTGLGLFQIGNHKTRTFDRNIEPHFNSDFVFEIAYNDIVAKNLSLVVAIWDQDSKSRDDYMAGFRSILPPSPPPSSSEWQLVPLQHQEPDGHPACISFNELIGGTTSKPPASGPGTPGPGSGSSGAGYPGGSGGGYNSGAPGAVPVYPGGNGSPGVGYPGGSGHPGPGYPGSGTPGAGYPGGNRSPGAGYPSGSGAPTPGYPGSGTQGSGYPASGNPGAGYPGGSSAPGAGYPSGAPKPGYPGGSGTPNPGYPGGSGAPGAGYPGGAPGSGSQGAGYPASGAPVAGYPGAKGAPSPYPGSPYPK